MKKYVLFALTAVICAAAVAGELVLNGDFSASSPLGLPLHWNCRGKNLAGIKVLPGNILQLNVDSKDNAVTLTQTIKLEEGKSYELSWEVRSAKGSNYRFYCEWITVDAAGKKKWAGSGGYPRKTSGEFKQEKVIFSMPDSLLTSYLAIRLLTPGEVEFRNVSLKPYTPPAGKKELGGSWELKGKCAFVKNGERDVLSVPAGRINSAVIREIPVISGKKYRLGFSVLGKGDAGNNTGFHGFRVAAIVGPDKKINAPWDDVWDSSFQNKQFIFSVPGKAGSKRTIDLSCSVTGTTGEVLFDKFTLSEVTESGASEWKFILTSPGYRNMIYSSLPVNEITGRLVNTVQGAASAEITFNGKADTVKLKDGGFGFKLPAGKLSDGSHELKAEIRDASGKVLKVVTDKITKLPPAKIEVVTGPRCDIYINGKPFMPMMFWNLPSRSGDKKFNDRIFYFAARQGLNCTKAITSNETDTLNLLDALDRYGIKLFLGLGFPASTDKATVLAWKHRIYNILTPRVLAHPALLGYFMADEPYWAGFPLNALLEAYKAYKEIDPYHPVWINAAPRGDIDIHEQYSEAADIYGVDIYPVPYPSMHSALEDKGLTSVGKYADRMSIAVGRRKPVGMALQGFAWESWADNPKRYPTYDEIRFMSFDAMINHANFVSFWGTKYIIEPGFYDILFKLTAEFQTLSGLFTRAVVVDDAKADSSDIRCRVLEYSGMKYLIAVNNTGKSVNAVISGRFSKPELMVFPGNAKIKLSDGSFRKTFNPFEVIVCGEAELPPPVYELPPVQPELDKAGNPFHEHIAVSKKLVAFRTKANWIWEKSGVGQAGSKAFMFKSFKLAEPIKSARLYIAVDDIGQVWLNGILLGECGGWSIMKAFDCTGKLKQGENYLYVAAQDAGHAPCGMLAELLIQYTDGSTMSVISDASWKAAAKASDSNKTSAGENCGDAAIVAPYGSGAWGEKVKVKPGDAPER